MCWQPLMSIKMGCISGLIKLCSQAQQMLIIMQVVSMFGACACQLLHQQKYLRKNKLTIQEIQISLILNLLS
uniref:Uncharacterized protein n=1 Tax=Arundo donax TaxID=35708 RepID=A0A0A9EU58_ARUDO